MVEKKKLNKILEIEIETRTNGGRKA